MCIRDSGCDSLVTASDVALDVLAPGKTRVIQNSHQQITGHFNRDRNLRFPVVELDNRLSAAVDADQIESFNASAIATQLLGDSIGSNLFMLGYAYQQGLIPVTASAIEAAIELNAVAVDMNKNAFLWGRRAARDLAAVLSLTQNSKRGADDAMSQSLDELINFHTSELTAYQNQRYADRYRKVVERVRVAERQQSDSETLTDAVARNLYKLMAYKDEYEVARLYSDGRFEEKLKEHFDGDYQLVFHLAPPVLARRDKQTGQLQKRDFGGWMLTAMRTLAKLRSVRGTALDIFGYTAERRAERALVSTYQVCIDGLLENLTADNLSLAVEIASMPEQVSGYGHIKEKALHEYEARQQVLLEQWPAGHVAVRKRA